jgi:hypothetical protein
VRQAGGIATTGQAVALGLKAVVQFGEIINLTVKDQMNGLIFICGGLMAAGDVKNGQSSKPESGVA